MDTLTLIPDVSKAVVYNSLENLVVNFINAQDVKDSSRETYHKALRAFTRWLQERGLQNPTREDILAYKDFLIAQGVSPYTLSSYITVVRAFFSYLESTIGYQNVAKGVKGARRSKGFRKDPLTLEQIRELLDAIDCSTIRGKRDYALLNLMLRTGLRTIEVVRVNIEDIRQQSGEAVLWIHGKGRDSKDEFVLLTQETLKPIYGYLAERGKLNDYDPLFVSISDRNTNDRLTTRSIRRIVKDRLRGISIDSDRLTAHSLRHTFATVALLNGAPLLQVKEAMRHNSVETTMIYAHQLDRIKNGAERYIQFDRE